MLQTSSAYQCRRFATMATNLFICSLFTFLICFWNVCSVDGLSLEDRLQQLTDNYIEMKSILQEKVTQLELKDARLEALELKIQEHYEIREDLKVKVTQLEAKVQQLFLAAQQNKQSATVTQSDVIGESKVSNGMPTSCADLNGMGHTLSGFYSVRGAAMMQSVYCDFTKQSGDPGFQELIGSIEVKSKPAIFYVQRSSSFTQINTPIPFQVERLNVGGAMNLASGIFTAPVPGNYFFSLSGTAYIAATTVRLVFTIGLYVNDNPIAYGYADEMSSDYQYETFSLQSAIYLDKGDEVWLQISSMATGVYLYGGLFTHFNGWLLQEDIFQSMIKS